MKIRIWPQADGTSRIYLQRTRPREGRNELLTGVRAEDLSERLGKAVKKMRHEDEVESPRLV